MGAWVGGWGRCIVVSCSASMGACLHVWRAGYFRHCRAEGNATVLFPRPPLPCTRTMPAHVLLFVLPAVLELERSLMELHQIFLDMAVLVEAQGEMLDNIEAQVGAWGGGVIFFAGGLVASAGGGAGGMLGNIEAQLGA